MSRWAAVAAVCLAAYAGILKAEEPAEEFFSGLRERGLYNLASDYLDQMESSTLAEQEFRRRLDYHRTVLALDRARTEEDPALQRQLLDEARTALDASIRSGIAEADVSLARGQLGEAYLNAARQRLDGGQGQPGNFSATGPSDAIDEVRGLITESQRLLAITIAFYDERLVSAADQVRQEFRTRRDQARFFQAQAYYEEARTHPANSGRFRDLNSRAADAMRELYQAHPADLIGFSALLYEGRCFQALREFQKALGSFDSLIRAAGAGMSDPRILRMLANAFQFRTQCHLERGQYDQAIEGCKLFLTKVRRGEEQLPEVMGVRFELAESYRLKSLTLDERSPMRRRLLRDASEEYSALVDTPGPLQRQAREMLSQLGEDSSGEPSPFTQSVEAGDAALANMQAAQVSLDSAAAGDAASRQQLEAQVERNGDLARSSYREALASIDEHSLLQDINRLRYSLCWLYWKDADYYRAAVLGEFLARRYPDFGSSRNAAHVALDAYQRIYNRTVSDGSADSSADQQLDRLTTLAEWITQEWPESSAAQDAFQVLIRAYLRSDRLAQARQLLDQINPASRNEMELRLGNAMWDRYRELSSRGEGDPAQLVRLLNEASLTLQRGLDQAISQRLISRTVTASLLYRVLILLEQKQYREARALLERPAMGPLTLVQSGRPEASRPEYVTEVYKAAVRVYLSLDPPQHDKALAMIGELERATGTQAAEGGDGPPLLGSYLSLGTQLTEQLDAHLAEGDTRRAQRMATALTDVLDRIAQRQDSAGWTTRLWLAHTYLHLADDKVPASSAAKEKAYAAGLGIYQKLLAEAQADPTVAPSPAALLEVQKGLADCLRESGNYAEAISTYSSILAEQANRLDVQMAAAYTYQERGEAEDPRWFELAIYGGQRERATGQNRIWGWARLAQIVERAARDQPRFRDSFFEARLNVIRCRFLAGVKSSGAEREENIALADDNLRVTCQAYPDLGGDRWRAEFDKLAKEIQEAQGRRPVGVQEFITVAGS